MPYTASLIASQAMAEYVGVWGGQFARALTSFAGGLTRTFQERPAVGIGVLVIVFLLMRVTRSRS